MLVARNVVFATQKFGVNSRPLPVRVVARLASTAGDKTDSVGVSSPFSQAIRAEQKTAVAPELRERIFNYKVDPDTAMKDYVGTGILEYKSGDIYEGEFVNGKKEGRGTIKYTNGETFTGTFKAGRIWSGDGYFNWNNGDSYKGSWANGLMSGRGVLTHALSGKHIKGIFRDGQIYEGSGTRVSVDGKAMAGVWQKGQFIPYQKLNSPQDPSKADEPRQATYRIDGDVYSGTWVGDKLQGQGTCVYKNGDVYEGEFKLGKRHGFGIYYSPGGPDVYGVPLREAESLTASPRRDHPRRSSGDHNTRTRTDSRTRGRDRDRDRDRSRQQQQDEERAAGYTYTGEWANGYRAGKGTVTYRNGGTYDGGWKGNCRHGRGILKYPDGAILEGEFRENDIYEGVGRFAVRLKSRPGYHLYEGTWHAGKLQGHGKCEYAMGEVYVGEWKDGQRHGPGRLTFPTGESVEGEFRADKVYTAQGSFCRRSGAVLKGQWVEGVFQGEELPPEVVEGGVSGGPRR